MSTLQLESAREDWDNIAAGYDQFVAPTGDEHFAGVPVHEAHDWAAGSDRLAESEVFAGGQLPRHVGDPRRLREETAQVGLDPRALEQSIGQ